MFSGNAGVGKNTIINRLLGEVGNSVYIPSVTTRGMREGESDGNPYYFETVGNFEAMVSQGLFLEYEDVHGNYYGTLRERYLEALRAGKIVLKDIDVKGAVSVKEEFGSLAYLIYVKPPDSGVLAERIQNRGDSKADIEHRRTRNAMEDSFAWKFDKLLVNDDINRAVQECRMLMDTNV